jgi:hypothetical protein
MKNLEIFKDLAARTSSPEDFARRGCEEGIFVSRAEGQRAWNNMEMLGRQRTTVAYPSALKQAGWGGLAQ